MIVFSKGFLKNGKSLVFFTLALAVAFCVSFLTVDMNDNPFQIKLGNYYNETDTFFSGFTFFTHFLYAKIASILGNQFVYYKLFNSFVVFITIFLPFLFIYKKNNKNILLLSSLVAILYIPFVRLSIGWDALSDLFIMLSFLLFLNIIYFQKKNKILKFVFILVCVIAITVKITNITLPFFYLFFYLLMQKFNINKLCIRNIFLYGILFVLFFGCFLLLFFSNIQTYFDFFTKTTGNLNESYSFTGMLDRIFTHLKFAIKPFLLASFFLYSFFIYKGKYVSFIRASFFVFTVIAFYHFIVIEKNFYIYNLVIEFFTIAIICFLLIQSKLEYKTKMVLFMILCIGFIPALGSNTGLAKMNTFVYLPIVYLIALQTISTKWFQYLLVLFFGYAIALKATYFVDMKPFYETKRINSGKLYPMISSEKNHKMFTVLDDKLKKHDIKKVYFYGMNSHIFDYLYDKNIPLFQTFDRNLNNENELSLFEAVLNNSTHNTVLIYSKDYYVSSMQTYKETVFYKKLNRFNPIVQEDEYFIYLIF